MLSGPAVPRQCSVLSLCASVLGDGLLPFGEDQWQNEVVTNILVRNLDITVTKQHCEKFLYTEPSKPSRSSGTGMGEPRGIAFVEMVQATEAAISALDGKILNERLMRINEACPEASARSNA